MSRQTKWRSRTLSRRLASWHCSSNSKPDQKGTRSIQLIPGAVLISQACYRSQACQTNTHLDLGCIEQEPLRSGAAKPLQGQLTSPRDKILLSIAFAGILTFFSGKTGLPGLAPFLSGSFLHHGEYGELKEQPVTVKPEE